MKMLGALFLRHTAVWIVAFGILPFVAGAVLGMFVASRVLWTDRVKQHNERVNSMAIVKVCHGKAIFSEGGRYYWTGLSS